MEIEEIHFATLDSSNLYAKEHLHGFPREKITLISVDEQRAGKGRFGRKWISGAKENLTLSFVFFIPDETQDALSLTHLLAIVIVEMLRAKGIKSRIKWPNDILVENRKIGGILCETQHMPPYFGVVMGLGLNVNMKMDDLQKVGQPATSIFEETSQIADIQEVKDQIVEKFSRELDVFLSGGFTPFLHRFREYTL